MPTPTDSPATTETRLGRLLRMGREAKKLTQKGLGAELPGELATTQSTVSAWEGGTVIPTIPYLLAVCRVLELDPTALIRAAEDDQADQLRAAAQS